MHYSPFLTSARDEVSDPARGDVVNDEFREQERASSNNSLPLVEESDAHAHEDDMNSHHNFRKPLQDGEFSVLSTLTQLFFNIDGYCKTPFCSDGDYLPPSCPSAGFYTPARNDSTPRTYPYHYDDGNQHSTQPRCRKKAATPLGESEQEVHDDDDKSTDNDVNSNDEQQGDSDSVHDIRTTNSGSSSHSGGSSNRHSSATPTTPRPHHSRRPLAFAVGYGDDLKDQQGRRVIITPRRTSPNGTRRASSPLRHRPDGTPYFPGSSNSTSGSVSSCGQRSTKSADTTNSAPMMVACTCGDQQRQPPRSLFALRINQSRNAPDSPHKATGPPPCKACSRRLRDESMEVPASRSLVGYLSRALDPSRS